MRRHGGDLLFSAALVVLGLAVAVGAVGYNLVGNGGRIAPGFTPFVAGLALTGFAAWAFAETRARSRRTVAAPARQQPQSGPSRGAEEPVEEPADTTRGPIGPSTAVNAERRAVLVFALLLATIALTFVTGFLLAFGLLILTLLWYVEREKPWLAVLVSVAAVLVAWLVFVQFLQVPLPGGVLGLLGRS